jgi:hypothetical protein
MVDFSFIVHLKLAKYFHVFHMDSPLSTVTPVINYSMWVVVKTKEPDKNFAFNNGFCTLTFWGKGAFYR